MYVPNFVPEPLEVPGNVTLLSWRERLRFVKRVIGTHFFSVLAIWGLSLVLRPEVRQLWAWGAAFGSLLLLDMVRIARRGRTDEAALSIAFSPLALVTLAVAFGASAREGWPVWALPVAPAMLFLYAWIADGDFSFVGANLLAGIGSLVTVSSICLGVHSAKGQAAWAILFALGYLTYIVYDLASLQSRRRESETGGAVVDLYRDVFNIFGYVLRVIAHWRRHRIWSS
ncbi:hypothetical protein EON81_01680 [bacterium]|nr:MAG: hypothetical protein EON81_01680 [bacterium]